MVLVGWFISVQGLATHAHFILLLYFTKPPTGPMLDIWGNDSSFREAFPFLTGVREEKGGDPAQFEAPFYSWNTQKLARHYPCI